jgi:DNA polymerase III subunit gamma/tau
VGLASKYRPSLFKDVIGQQVSAKILANSLLMNKIPTAILISGLFGTGKTTIARIFAKYLNCASPIDGEPCLSCPSCLENNNPSILEIDAASENSVDDIRELENFCQQVSPYKRRVILLDECHALSKAAQSAFLKLLEEPPKNVLFILLTTDPMKLEETIRSRCLSIPLRVPTSDEIFENLTSIVQKEGIQCDGTVLRQISEYTGSIRDTLQVLERLILLANGDQITTEVLDNSGQVITLGQYKDLAYVLCKRDMREALVEVDRWYQEGYDLVELFSVGLPILLRDFLMYVTESSQNYMTGISHESFVYNCLLTMENVALYLREWEMTNETMRHTSFPKIIWGVWFSKVLN